MESIDNSQFEPLTPIETAPVDAPNEAQQSLNTHIQNSIKNTAKSNFDVSPWSTASRAYDNSNIFDSGLASFGKQDNKISFENYNIRAEEVFDTLSSGEKVNRFGDNTYFKGTDNMERIAQAQSTSEKWGNGIYKFGKDTGSAIFGGTIGTINGVFEAVSQGSMNAFYDNDLNDWLDDSQRKTRYEFANYYTKQENNENFFEQLNNANFWADKVLGAASFTVGAIVSEGIWAWATGGASIAGSAARLGARAGKIAKWGKLAAGVDDVAKGMTKYKGWNKKPLYTAFKRGGMANKNAAIVAGRVAEFGNAGRFLLTSSAYEAGVESMHFKKEAEENFYREFQDINGRMPNRNEISDFTNQMENSANAVFASNMALLGVSNAVMFGTLFKIKSPLKPFTKNINKNLFGIGTKSTTDSAGKTVVEALKATRKQKLFSGAFSAATPILTESIWEEGGQSVASKTAGHWLASGYNPKYNQANMDIMEAMYKAMGETYATKEGWVELGIGAIIGGGSSVIQGGGKPKELRDIQNAREFQEKTVAKGMNTFSRDIMVQRMIMNNKVQNAVERKNRGLSNGDVVEAKLAEQEILLAEMEFNETIGESVKDLTEKYSIALDNVTPEEWQEAGIEDIDTYKKNTLASYESLNKRYRKNSEYAKAVMGVTAQSGQSDANSEYAKSLAYIITTGENADISMQDSLLELEGTIGVEGVKALKAQNKLRVASGRTQKAIEGNVNKTRQLTNQRDALQKKIVELQGKLTDENSGRKLGDANQKLLEVESQLNELSIERDTLAKNISEEQSRRNVIDNNNEPVTFADDFISGEDLMNIDKRIENIESKINSYEGVNPKIYSELLEITNQYKSAQEKFLNAQNVSIALASGQLRLNTKNIGGLLGKVLVNKVKPDEFTQAFLDDLTKSRLNAYAKEANSEANVKPNSIKEELQKKKNEAVQPQTNKKGLEKIQEDIDNALNSRFYSLGYTGEQLEEIVKDRPDQKDIERYEQLKSNNDRLAEEEFELEALEDKLSKWKMVSSAVTNGVSIATLIERKLSLQGGDIEVEQVKEEHTPQDIEITSKSLDASGNEVVEDLTQNTSGNATVKLDKDGNIRLSHIKVINLLSKLVGKISVVNTEKGKVVEEDYLPNEDFEKYNKKGFTFRVATTDGRIIDFNIVGGNVITMTEEDFNQNKDDLNLHIIDTGEKNWSFRDLYEISSNGELIQRTSDFTGDNIDEQEIYNLTDGDEVSFFYDSQDDWNVKQKALLQKGKITPEEYRDSIKVFIVKNGENVGVLKANSQEEISEPMLNIRDKAVRVAELGDSAVFGSTTVTQVFLGSVKMAQIAPNGNVENIAITERASQEVIATGYILDNEFVLSDKSVEGVDQTFVGKISSVNEGVKIPVVVFMKGVRKVAYPVTLNKVNNSKVREFSDILNSDSSDKISGINNLLKANGINPENYGLTSIEEIDVLQEIENKLASLEISVSMEDFSSAEYNNLSQDAQINIDLEDIAQTITSPKVRIDLETYKLQEDKELKNTSKVEIEDRLYNIALQAYNISFNRNGEFADSKGDTIETGIINKVYQEDGDLEIGLTNTLRKAQETHKFIEDVYPILLKSRNRGDKKIREVLGKETMRELENLISRYEYLNNNLDTSKIKGLKNTVNNLNCKN